MTDLSKVREYFEALEGIVQDVGDELTIAEESAEDTLEMGYLFKLVTDVLSESACQELQSALEDFTNGINQGVVEASPEEHSVLEDLRIACSESLS